ncbi:30S ribosomal protein S18 [Lyticum sinuosum]|uniref:30S ribosomal protein S18 n=1 Tax=Lyticum sinuosum TaxID=1332059 RepID=A0AAE5AHJ1_9RICK|nr:30S ribosomal protein S18 [Lyticum sinuosum]MDZ5761086.1 30S ribosomal protein S18 [Lyticum sinuosum]
MSNTQDNTIKDNSNELSNTNNNELKTESGSLPLVSNSILFNKIGNTEITSGKKKKGRKNRIKFNYKDIDTLNRYVLENGGRIPPARITKLSRSEQRSLAKAIKIARQLMLMPHKCATVV